MKVVILAGGKGTRISEESINKPKPLIEIGAKPIIWHIMKPYSQFGLNDFIICCGYKKVIYSKNILQIIICIILTLQLIYKVMICK